MTLALADVAKSFPTPAGTRNVLRDVNFQVGSGEIVHLDGPSGSGKSTLINVCGLLTPATAGSVLIDGVGCTTLGDRERTRVRARFIGFVFQSHHLLPELTSVENVLVAALRPDRVAIETRLREVGLAEHLNDRAKLLSGGQQQRVAVVRALINQPSVVLADEPVSGLDEASGRTVLDLLQAAAAAGAAVVIASHDARVNQVCHRTLTMHEGRPV